MNSPELEELLGPPPAPSRPFPWRPALALFLPAAALAAGTGLQRFAAAPGDAVEHWLLWSTAAGLLTGLVVGLVRKRSLPWALYGAASPWLVAAAVAGGTRAARPLREAVADRRETACRAEGRAVCTLAAFTGRCSLAQAQAPQAKALLGDPRSSSCSAQGCTFKWVYAGPFRPEQTNSPALACFVQTDAQGRGIRHWLAGVEN